MTTKKTPGEDPKPRLTKKTTSKKNKKSASEIKAAVKKKSTPSGTATASVARSKKPAKSKKITSSATGSDKAKTRLAPRMLLLYRNEVAPAMLKEFKYTSPMGVPKLSKIVLNMGMGEALENSRALENASRDLALISGQRPITTKARKSIANFKIREGMPIGLSVTLRGRRMYEFVDRLVSSALPRIRDFRGLSRKAFDGRGNYSLGIREHTIFPEIDYNTMDRIRGLEAAIVTTARTDTEGLRLLEMLGVPLIRPETQSEAA